MTPRPRLAAADRREQLLDVAADIVAAGGARALTVDAVVAKAEVHRPVVYRHFANAEVLLDAVVERGLNRLHHATETAVTGKVGFEARMRAAVGAWMELFAKDPVVMSIALVRPPSNDPLRARRRQQNRLAVRFVAAEFAAAGVDAVDAEIAGATLLHGLVGIVELWAAKRINRRVAIDRYVRIATATLRELQPQT